MTVSRKGKRGNRAGRLRPASRAKRVTWNARLKNVTKTNDDRPVGREFEKYEWVIACVARAVGAAGGTNYIAGDDTASDILLALLDAGGFNWDEDEIIGFCRKRARWAIWEHVRRIEKAECEFYRENDEGEYLWNIERAIPPPQDDVVDAHHAAACLRAIPTRQRQALEILCDGGNPIDVAEEMGITPWAAIALIKEGREYVDRVDPA